MALRPLFLLVVAFRYKVYGHCSEFGGGWFKIGGQSVPPSLVSQSSFEGFTIICNRDNKMYTDSILRGFHCIVGLIQYVFS